jgi:hypothetical protein
MVNPRLTAKLMVLPKLSWRQKAFFGLSVNRSVPLGV